MSDECYTPADRVQPAHDVMGGIDLDPASCAEANAIVRARRYFSALLNGLTRRWTGRVWLNCPFSNPRPWAEKLIASYRCGDVTEAISLWNSRTGSRWFDLMAAHAWRCEVKRRIRFWGPGTSSSKGEGNGRQDQVYFYLGARPERFAARFASIGRIVPPSSHELELPRGDGRTCVACRRPLTGRRTDSETCSNACRQRRYRQQRRAAAATEA